MSNVASALTPTDYPAAAKGGRGDDGEDAKSPCWSGSSSCAGEDSNLHGLFAHKAPASLTLDRCVRRRVPNRPTSSGWTVLTKRVPFVPAMSSVSVNDEPHPGCRCLPYSRGRLDWTICPDITYYVCRDVVSEREP